MVDRKPGYYWVKPVANVMWRVAMYNGTDWFHLNCEADFPEPHVVGPKIEPPA